ncbi:glutathionylspermidine synthase family protein [Sphingomonas ginsenosidivorax]|uniref:Glutathionylspermidine synthase family protein n=1 Tax=Sphingomonas ginsenosidivorax TaxID=862135 RepID=A0A5C6UDY8_9SPHN|nr:glutathionylspermidine synthase family protein [Sphingomonas ginsenosidivorax]TXC70630.1 glutathionylspermidine synthase family protein [Sphingomonas ginsenosidivorax]
MKRIALDPRSDWRAQADAIGFVYHDTGGAPYWDESAAYAFTLAEIENDLEPAAEALHAMCLDLVDTVVRDQVLMERLAIPRAHWNLVAESWRTRQPSLYGRFDFAYDGTGPAKLYEYNADTPTSVFECATFQWIWLEELIGKGMLPPGSDQFNSLFDKLRDRFAQIFPTGGFVHFAADATAIEDRQTVRFFEDLATQVGIEPKFVEMKQIGLNGDGRFVDDDGFELQAAFKLYPWEFMLREDYAPNLAKADVRWIEPAWKAILSNKGILPLLWERHPNHPNLLPAFFDDDPAAAILGPRYVRKPLFSREGANVELVEEGGTRTALDEGYGAEGFIRQAYAPPPTFDGRHPVIGAWIVGDAAAGIGVREDDDVVTRNLARFVPHYIETEE